MNMHRGLAFGAVAFMVRAAAEPPATRKRGFAGFMGQYFTCDDAAALGLQDSWAYTWMMSASQRNKCAGKKIVGEFTPMINGVGESSKYKVEDLRKLWSHANVHYLLGYNEPDYGNGHNHPHMATPAKAAADWPKLQKLAAEFDPPLTLVGPAVSSGAESGGSDAWDSEGRSTWLDEFFGNCTNVVKLCDPSSVKYIAMHDYQGDVAKLHRRISGAVKHYGGRKVWLTEFAITKWGAPPSRARQDAFLKEALPYLDASDDVFRYNWFSSRNAPNDQNGGSNLLPYDSNSTTPTSTGLIYKGAKTTISFFV